MASAEKFQLSFDKLKRAFRGFEALINQTLLDLNPVLKDGIINGRIHKFEITSELLWKTCRLFLELNNGIIQKSPKMVYKTFFQEGYIDEPTTVMLDNIVDDRNFLSHEYAEEYFDKIHDKLPGYIKVMKQLVEFLESESKPYS